MSGTTSNIAFRAASRRCRSATRRRRDRRASRPPPRAPARQGLARSLPGSSGRRSGRRSPAASRRRRDWRTGRRRTPRAARCERHAAARRRGGDGDRIGDRLAVARGKPRQRLAVPRGARGEAERAALRGRLQPPLGRAGERDRQFVDLVERRPIRARRRRGSACANSDRVERGAPKRARSASQAASEAASVDVARLVPPIRGRANRRRRRPERPATARAAAALAPGVAVSARGHGHGRDRGRDAVIVMVVTAVVVVDVGSMPWSDGRRGDDARRRGGVVVIVIMAVPARAHIGAAFRIERRLDRDDGRAEAARHVLDHRIAADAQALVVSSVGRWRLPRCQATRVSAAASAARISASGSGAATTSTMRAVLELRARRRRAASPLRADRAGSRARARRSWRSGGDSARRNRAPPCRRARPTIAPAGMTE